jgi:hypothetical protein
VEAAILTVGAVCRYSDVRLTDCLPRLTLWGRTGWVSIAPVQGPEALPADSCSAEAGQQLLVAGSQCQIAVPPPLDGGN